MPEARDALCTLSCPMFDAPNVQECSNSCVQSDAAKSVSEQEPAEAITRRFCSLAAQQESSSFSAGRLSNTKLSCRIVDISRAGENLKCSAYGGVICLLRRI